MANVSRTASWQLDATDALAKLAKLPENWDGYGSPAIRPSAIASASRLISAIDRSDLASPSVSPVTGGGIGLAWQVGTRELEFEVLPDGSVQYLQVETNEETGQESNREGRLAAEPMPVQSLIDWLCGD